MDGTYHAIFHHMYGYDTENQWWLDAVGGHAFSEDGISWTYSGVAWGNATTTKQGNVVTFADSTSFRFTDANGRISCLIKKRSWLVDNGAQYGTGKILGSTATTVTLRLHCSNLLNNRHSNTRKIISK